MSVCNKGGVQQYTTAGFFDEYGACIDGRSVVTYQVLRSASEEGEVEAFKRTLLTLRAGGGRKRSAGAVAQEVTDRATMRRPARAGRQGSRSAAVRRPAGNAPPKPGDAGVLRRGGPKLAAVRPKRKTAKRALSARGTFDSIRALVQLECSKNVAAVTAKAAEGGGDAEAGDTKFSFTCAFCGLTSTKRRDALRHAESHANGRWHFDAERCRSPARSAVVRALYQHDELCRRGQHAPNYIARASDLMRRWAAGAGWDGTAAEFRSIRDEDFILVFTARGPAYWPRQSPPEATCRGAQELKKADREPRVHYYTRAFANMLFRA